MQYCKMILKVPEGFLLKNQDPHIYNRYKFYAANITYELLVFGFLSVFLI
jgi:hypothetical protein